MPVEILSKGWHDTKYGRLFITKDGTKLVTEIQKAGYHDGKYYASDVEVTRIVPPLPDYLTKYPRQRHVEPAKIGFSKFKTAGKSNPDGLD